MSKPRRPEAETAKVSSGYAPTPKINEMMRRAQTTNQIGTKKPKDPNRPKVPKTEAQKIAKVKKVVQKAINGPARMGKTLLCEATTDYLTDLHNAEGDHGKGIPFVPGQVAPAQSYKFRTVYLDTNTTALSTAMAGCEFPGHTLRNDLNPGDDVSQHAYTQRFAGVTEYVIGPVGDGTRSGAIGAYQTGLGAPAFLVDSSTATPTTAVDSDPFSCSDGAGEHSRWRVKSARVVISIQNTGGNIGGTFHSVQPATRLSSSSIGAHVKEPEYRMRSVDADHCEFVFDYVPRLEDLAYWHSERDAATIATNLQEAWLKWCFVNAAGSTATVSIMKYYNWEVTGNRVLQYSTPCVNNALAGEQIIAAIEQMWRNGFSPRDLRIHAEIPAARVHPDIGVEEETLWEHFRQLATKVGRKLITYAEQAL